MQIMASAGYAAESDMQRYWRDARLYTFGEGSSEILLDLIAQDIGVGRGFRMTKADHTLLAIDTVVNPIRRK